MRLFINNIFFKGLLNGEISTQRTLVFLYKFAP